MRRWYRPEPPPCQLAFLQRKQTQVNSGGDVQRLWRSARRTQSIRSLALVLARMTGASERCMYCQDSRGTDIEHFRPKASYRAHVFIWSNWLWACSACNRSKGNRFPDENGVALLIDPTAEDPWDYLFFDSTTGEITARWHGPEEHRKGRTTLDILEPLRSQAVCEGRARTRRRLAQAVERFLDRGRDEAAGEGVDTLLQSLRDDDSYGLVEWFLARDGSDDAPFSRLRSACPQAWTRARLELLGLPG